MDAFFEHLLSLPELDWLEWKADFPPGLLASAKDPDWDPARAKVLRAMSSIANTVSKEPGYLVYGVDNSTRPRTVSGSSKSFDDADFQDWALATFRPAIDFTYSEREREGKQVGVFEIRPASNFPHVCEKPLGGILADGQVWLRRGTRCSIAHHEDLQRMFEPRDPLIISNPNGPVVKEIRELWDPLGWEPYLPTKNQQADCMAKGDRLAHLPGSRREIHFSSHVLMLRPKQPAG